MGSGPGGGGRVLLLRLSRADGFADFPVEPVDERYSKEHREFLLPYEAVRTAPDPDAALLRFLDTTYWAAAERGSWNRAALEADPHRWDHARRIGTRGRTPR